MQGKKKVKNFHNTHIKLLAYNHSFFSSVIKENGTGKLSEYVIKQIMPSLVFIPSMYYIYIYLVHIWQKFERF